MQFFAQQWWKSGYSDHFHTYSQWFAVNFSISKISIPGKCSKCLKQTVLSKITVFQVCLKVFPCNFLFNSGESQDTVISFSHIHSGLQEILLFQNFNRWKMLKMLKIDCFKQNYCISGMPKGIPMQFFVQQWWKSGYSDHFHTYSQWFAVNFSISKISIPGKCSKCLK